MSNAFLIFLTRFFPSLANLVVLVLFSRLLPQIQYGSYTHFWIHLNLLYPVACIGVHILILTYPPDVVIKLAKGISAKYYLAFFAWLLIIGSLFAFLQLEGPQLPCWLSFVFILFVSLLTIFESILIVFKGFKVLVVTNIIYSLLFIVAHWLFFSQQWSLNSLFVCLLAVNAFKLLVYTFSTQKFVRQLSFSTKVTVLEMPHKITNLWLHLGIYDISQNMFTWVDKFIISLVLLPSLSAIYYNGSMNIPFLPLLLSAAGSAILIQLSTSNKSTATNDLIKLMNQSGRVLSSIVFPIFCFMLVFRYELVIGLFSIKYSEAVPIFAISLLVLPLRAYSFTTALQKLHKGAILNIGGIADLLIACSLMYPLYQLIGLPGVALSFVISTYLQAAFYLFYSAKALSCNMLSLVPLRNWVSKLVLFGVLFITFHFVAQNFLQGFFSLILGGIVLVLSVFVSLWFDKKSNRNFI